MKRTAKATQPKTEAKKYVSVPLFDAPVFESVNDKCSRYKLGEGVSLDICEGDKSDYGSLNIYGVIIKVSFREVTKGENKGSIFVSYPQYKNKDGEYIPYVVNYSKALNESIRTALTMHYDSDGYMSVPEGDEELPFPVK